MKDNKLIAEFMDLRSTGMSIYKESEYKYHTSWAWLMPVVEKIDDYLFRNKGKVGYFDDCLNSNDIEVRYQAVVEFIEWHSQQQKDYNARIKWLDTGDIRDVIITTKEVGEDDDQIFFYFESESEIKEFMKEGKNEFIILEYSSFDKS